MTWPTVILSAIASASLTYIILRGPLLRWAAHRQGMHGPACLASRWCHARPGPGDFISSRGHWEATSRPFPGLASASTGHPTMENPMDIVSNLRRSSFNTLVDEVGLAPDKPPTLTERLHQADANAERHYLLGEQSTRLSVAWSVTWLTWDLGVGVSHSPYASEERWGVGLYLGPFVFEVFTPAAMPGLPMRRG